VKHARHSLLLACLASLAACTAERPEAPNIILVTVDTLRWDYLATYGYPEAEISPFVSRLADQGIVYERAVSTAGTTIPAHGSMLTGVYARMHGARSNFHGMYEGVPTVTRDLQAAGYQTGAFVSNQFLIKVGGLGAGFDVNNTPFRDPQRGGRPQLGSKTAGQANEWLASLDSDRPAFLWLHLWEPHGPYDASEWSRSRLQGYDGFLGEGVSLDHVRGQVRDIVNDPQHVAAMRTHYAGEVNLADHYFGEVLGQLEALGRLENSVVIFTADHGQALAENSRMGHGPIFWETVLRVPLIVADFRSRNQARVNTRVGIIDIAPSIAAAAGLPEAGHYPGRSLLDPEALEAEAPYFAEVALRTETDRNWERVKGDPNYDPEALTVYVDDFKMTFSHGEYSLARTGVYPYRAEALPGNAEPVMYDYLAGLIESFQTTSVDLSAGEVSEEDIEALKSLGYTQ
jgi:arylsulfatase A-like enzyme